LGNPNLNPESAYSIDMGLRVWKPKFSFQLGFFSNWLSDMIVETPGEFIYTINTGPLEGVIDTLPALVNSNVNKAWLYGADFGTQYSVYRGFTLFGSGAYVRGEDTKNNTNLPLIPPVNGRVGVRYTYPKIGTAELTVVGALEQDKVADGEQETGGFSRLDIALSSAKVNLGVSKLQLFAGIENITDKRYTNHLATNRGAISVEPGRNIYFRLNITF
jgi:outer membrane receptor protein involved in Fe transport